MAHRGEEGTDHTVLNVGRIASALYSAFRTVHLFDQGPIKRRHRFAVGDGNREQVLTATHEALRDLEWRELEGFITTAIAALRNGASAVTVTRTGVTPERGH